MLVSLAAAEEATNLKTTEVTLNQLKITLDSDTGCILKMSYPGPGAMIDSKPSNAALIDLAYPLPSFDALRMASRFSKGAKISVSPGKLTIHYDNLGKSRSIDLPGKVGATVTFTADPDGRSVVASCDVSNSSELPVRQVIFPDLGGLLPFAGPYQTILKTGGFGSAPFIDLAITDEEASDQFCLDHASYSAQYVGGGMFSSMWMRWLDFGGLNGGLSIFPKRWGWDPQVPVRLYRSQTEEKLRMLFIHDVSIAPGEKWSSGEFVLTPHASGWAKGIEPYREWVKEHQSRMWPVPRHIREGLGFRTVWMTLCQPGDPSGDIIWKFGELPEVAKESREHGLDEMVMWSWVAGFELPLPGPLPHLGTSEDMKKAYDGCRREGVNLSPFISVLQAAKATAHKYGLTVPDVGGWPQHTEYIPQFQAPYATSLRCAQADTAHPVWQAEALASMKALIDQGMPSISWDQFWVTQKEPNIQTLVSQIRDYATARDPQATFSGEELWNLEVGYQYLDYSWNWGGYRDCQAYTSVYECPRRSCCITFSPWNVKLGFADNLYLNIFPRKPDSVNGSDYIRNYPEFSKALKQCAKLRKQFLPYFTEGTLIGSCVLTAPAAPARVTAYALPDRLMMVVLNPGGPQGFKLPCALEPWLSKHSAAYSANVYDADGVKVSSTQVQSGKFDLQTPVLGYQELVVVEVVPG